MIYHGGTGRTTFLAMIKVTTLFVSAFFCFAVVPGYIKADKPFQETFAGKPTLIAMLHQQKRTLTGNPLTQWHGAAFSPSSS